MLVLTFFIRRALLKSNHVEHLNQENASKSDILEGSVFFCTSGTHDAISQQLRRD